MYLEVYEAIQAGVAPQQLWEFLVGEGNRGQEPEERYQILYYLVQMVRNGRVVHEMNQMLAVCRMSLDTKDIATFEEAEEQLRAYLSKHLAPRYKGFL